MRTLTVSLDGERVPIAPDVVRVTIPDVDDFHFGFAPILVEFTLALPTTGSASDHLSWLCGTTI